MSFDPNKLPPGCQLFPTPTYFDTPQFFGREVDFQRVKQLLDAGSSVAISGKRRIGKSWFLEHLRDSLPQNSYLTIYSDELKPDTIIPGDLKLFLWAVIYALSNAINHHFSINLSCQLLDPANPPSNYGLAFRSDLEKLHQYLVNAQLTAVFLIDESEALYDLKDEGGSVSSFVKSLAAKYKFIRIIAAGYNLRFPTNDHPYLFDNFAHYQLYGIGAEGARKLIVEQLAQYNVRFEFNDLWSKVLLLTGEEPIFLRFLGQQLVEQARHNNGMISIEQINIAVEDFFDIPDVQATMNNAWSRLGENQPIHSLVTSFAYNHKCNLKLQDILVQKVMQQFYSGKPPECVHNDLQRLHALGFLREQESIGTLQFSSELLRLWICKHRPNPGIGL